MMLAELTGNIHIGLAFGGAAIGIGVAAAGGVMAIGRNPGAFGKVFESGNCQSTKERVKTVESVFVHAEMLSVREKLF